VRRITCVRTSTAGWLALASEVVRLVELGRSATVANPPAANAVSAAAILVLVMRIGRLQSIGCTPTVPTARESAAQDTAKLW